MGTPSFFHKIVIQQTNDKSTQFVVNSASVYFLFIFIKFTFFPLIDSFLIDNCSNSLRIYPIQNPVRDPEAVKSDFHPGHLHKFPSTSSLNRTIYFLMFSFLFGDKSRRGEEKIT